MGIDDSKVGGGERAAGLRRIRAGAVEAEES